MLPQVSSAPILKDSKITLLNPSPFLAFTVWIRTTGRSWPGVGLGLSWDLREHLTLTLFTWNARFKQGGGEGHSQVSLTWMCSVHFQSQHVIWLGTMVLHHLGHLFIDLQIESNSWNLLPACHLAVFLSPKKMRWGCMQSDDFTQVSKDSLQIKCKYLKCLHRSGSSKKQNSVSMSRRWDIFPTSINFSRSAFCTQWSSASKLVHLPLSLRRHARLKVSLTSSLPLEDNCLIHWKWIIKGVFPEKLQ